ncbi:MAG: hypothetical protein JO022_02805 [Acidobacteriaceae bacterium]|nr:hypothetical protein [Acidobacteriaceae bacterium]
MLNHNEYPASTRRLPEAEREAFALHRERLMQEVQPLSPIELDLFEELAAASWDLIRYRRMEDDIFLQEPNPLLNPASAKALDRIHKYRAAAQRSYRATLNELRQIQTNYALKALIPPAIRSATPGIVDSAKVLRNLPKPPKPEKNTKSQKLAPPPFAFSNFTFPETYAEYANAQTPDPYFAEPPDLNKLNEDQLEDLTQAA